MRAPFVTLVLIALLYFEGIESMEDPNDRRGKRIVEYGDNSQEEYANLEKHSGLSLFMPTVGGSRRRQSQHRTNRGAPHGPPRRQRQSGMVEYPVTEEAFQELSQHSRGLKVKIPTIGKPVNPSQMQHAVDDFSIPTAGHGLRPIKTEDQFFSEGNAIQTGWATPHLRGKSQLHNRVPPLPEERSSVQSQANALETTDVYHPHAASPDPYESYGFHSSGNLGYHYQQQLNTDDQYNPFLYPPYHPGGHQ